MEVINGFVFIRADKPDEKRDSGIIVPTELDQDPNTGEIVYGDGAGKRVYFKRYKFEDIKVGKETLMVGKAEDIMAYA